MYKNRSKQKNILQNKTYLDEVSKRLGSVGYNPQYIPHL